MTYEEGTGRSFTDQATHRAIEAAVVRIEDILEQKSLTGEGISVGQGEGVLAEIDATATEQPTAAEFNRATNRSPLVFHRHHYARDGGLFSEPPVAVESVVNETPRSPSMTVTDSNNEYVAVLPVMCDRGWIQNG